MPLNIDWQQILLHLLNFTILAFGLYFLLYRPVRAYMKKREDAMPNARKRQKKRSTRRSGRKANIKKNSPLPKKR